MTARDLARLGLLMLQKGIWNGSQVIPAGWVEESTYAHTTDTHPLQSDGAGYGYLWWVNGFRLPEKSFSARGAFAKYLVVIPERGFVKVSRQWRNHVRGRACETANYLSITDGALVGAAPARTTSS